MVFIFVWLLKITSLSNLYLEREIWLANNAGKHGVWCVIFFCRSLGNVGCFATTVPLHSTPRRPPDCPPWIIHSRRLIPVSILNGFNLFFGWWTKNAAGFAVNWNPNRKQIPQWRSLPLQTHYLRHPLIKTSNEFLSSATVLQSNFLKKLQDLLFF